MPSSTAGTSNMPSEPFVEAEQGTSGSEPAIARAWPPDPNERIALSVAGESWDVPWGRHDEFGTPAYWIDQTRKSGYADDWRDLMRPYLVRRTRTFIQKNYTETDPETGRPCLIMADGSKRIFPERVPKTVTFQVDDKDPKKDA